MKKTRASPAIPFATGPSRYTWLTNTMAPPCQQTPTKRPCTSYTLASARGRSRVRHCHLLPQNIKCQKQYSITCVMSTAGSRRSFADVAYSHIAFKTPPFRCAEEGWGEFDMNISLSLIGKGPDHSLSHDLNFQQEEYEATHKVVSSTDALLSIHPPQPANTRLAASRSARELAPADTIIYTDLQEPKTGAHGTLAAERVRTRRCQRRNAE